MQLLHRGACCLEHAHLKKTCFKRAWWTKKTADALGGVRNSLRPSSRLFQLTQYKKSSNSVEVSTYLKDMFNFFELNTVFSPFPFTSIPTIFLPLSGALDIALQLWQCIQTICKMFMMFHLPEPILPVEGPPTHEKNKHTQLIVTENAYHL